MCQIKLIHNDTDSNRVEVWTQICLNSLLLCQTALHQAHHSGIWHSTISNNHSWNLLLLYFPCLMIPPLFLQPPVDKSFSFIAQTQGLQVHRPQKGEKEGGAEGVCVGGAGMGGGNGKENGQSGDKRGRNRAPLPWFNLYTHPSCPSPPATSQTPATPLCFARLPCNT